MEARGIAAPRQEAGAHAWWVAGGCTLGLTLGASVLVVFTFGVFVGPLEREFGWSRAQIAFAATLFSYAAMVIGPLQGYLADRFGARRIILASIPLFCAGLASLYFLPNNLTLFYAAWIVIPFLGVGIWPVSYAKVAAAWFEERLGLALGIVNAGIGIGSALLPIVLAALIGAYGWRLAYVALAAIAFAVTFTNALLLVHDKPADRGLLPYGARPGTERAARAVSGMPFREVLRNRDFRLMVVILFLLGVITTGIIAHLVPLVIDAGIAPQRAATVMTAFGLAMIAGRVIVGMILDHYFAPHVTVFLLLSAMGAFVILAVTPTMPWVYVAAALIGVTVGGEFDVLGYLIRRYFGIVDFGKVYGALFGIFQLGAGIGAISLGLIRTAQGSYATGMWVFVAICAFILVPLLALSRYDRPEEPPALPTGEPALS